MNWDDVVVKLNVTSLNIDLNNPLNINDHDNSSGTGFFLSKKLILTCYHVVKFALSIEVIYKGNYIYNGKILYIMPDDDIALIELNENIDIKPLDYHIITTKEINQVYAVGFPLGSDTIIGTKGIISGFTNSYIQIDAALNPGNSGGPLLIKINGEWKIIGINVSKIYGEQVENTNFSVPIYRFFSAFNCKFDKNIDLNILNGIVRKPIFKLHSNLLTFKYQKILQPELKNEYYNEKLKKYLDNNIGIRINKINPNIYLGKYINEGDLLLKINGVNIDSSGNCIFPFYPGKINILQIGLWFKIGDDLELTIFDNKTKDVITKKLKFEKIETFILDLYMIKPYDKYYFVNNDLIFSIITFEHLTNNINFSNHQYLNLIKRVENNIFTIYLADIIYANKNDKFTKYPINDIIIEINDIQIDNYDTFKKLMENKVTKIKTINNSIYYA